MSAMKPVIATLGAALLLACSDQGPEAGAVVTFGFDGRTETLRVLITDPATIAEAEEWIATGTGPSFPIGPIVRGAGVDARYPFHFVPDEVRLAELAVEVCDGAPMKTPEQVDDFFEGATGNRFADSATWCPWGAYPISIVR